MNSAAPTSSNDSVGQNSNPHHAMAEPEKKAKTEPTECCVCYQACQATWICGEAAKHVTCAACCANLVATKCPMCGGQFIKPTVLPSGLLRYDLDDEEKEFKRLLSVPGSSDRLKHLWPERPRSYTAQGFGFLKQACLHGNAEWAIHALDADCAFDYYQYCATFIAFTSSFDVTLFCIENELFLEHVLQHHMTACMAQLLRRYLWVDIPESAACRGLLFSFISTYSLLRYEELRQVIFAWLIKRGDPDLLRLSVAQLGTSFTANDVHVYTLLKSSTAMVKWVLEIFPQCKNRVWDAFEYIPLRDDDLAEFVIKECAPQDWWWPTRWGPVPDRFRSYAAVYWLSPYIGEWQAVAEREWGQGPFIKCFWPNGVFRLVSSDAPGPKTVTCEFKDAVYVLYFKHHAKVALFTSNTNHGSYRKWKFGPKQRISSDIVCVVHDVRVVTFDQKSHRPF